MSNPFDEFDEPSPRLAGPTAAQAANPFDEFDAAPESSSFLRRAVADTGVSLAKGVVGLGEAAVGLADIPTLGHAGKALEDYAGYDPGSTQQFLEGLYSPEQQAANRAVGEAEGVGGTLSALAENPSVIPHKLVETLPLLAGGGAVARIPALAKLTPLTRGAIGEGALGAGSSAEQTRQETETGTLTPGQAGLAATSGAVTGLITRGGGAVANRLGIGDIEQILAGDGLAPATAKGFARRTLEGAVTEGLLEEAPQSASEQALQNLALGKPALERVPEAATLGGVIGSVMGGGVALVAPREQAPSPEGESEIGADVGLQDLDPAAQQHMQDILQGGPPLGPAPPPSGPPPSGPLGRAAQAGGITQAAPAMGTEPVAQPVTTKAGLAPRKRGALSPLGAALAEQGKAEVAAEQTRLAEQVRPPDTTTSSIKTEKTDTPFNPPELRHHKLNSPRTEANARTFAEGLAGRFPHLAFEAVPHRLAKNKFAVKASPGGLDQAAHGAATSPQNDLPQPTEPQIESGNYQKGHVRYAGLEISIENPTGSKRSGVDPKGKPWEVEMSAHYGYIKRTEGNDGEQVDVYLAGEREDTPAFVVDQVDPKTGRFDEHKIVLGAASRGEAEAIYDAHFSDQSGPARRQAITELPIEGFKRWLKEGKTKKPIAGQAGVQAPPFLGTIDAPQQAGGLPEEEVVDASRETELQPPPQFEQQQAGLSQGPDRGGLGVAPGEQRAAGDSTASAAADGAEAAADAQALVRAPQQIPPTQSLAQGEIASPGASQEGDSSPIDEDISKNLPKGTIVGTAEDLGALYDEAVQKRGLPKKSAVRYQVVGEEEAARLKKTTGLDLRGYKHTVDNFALRKIHKDHGQIETEEPRGQAPITREDIRKIPEIVNGYDAVEHLGQDPRGNDLIRYRKRDNGVTYYVEEVRNNRWELMAKNHVEDPHARVDADFR